MKTHKLRRADRPANIRKAVSILKRGGLVAFPTETVYGLGADALNARAVCKIFSVKKRPAFDPLIVHVASPEQAMSLCKKVPRKARILMKTFWPGPLTLVLEKRPLVPDVVTAGLSTVAVRMPRHDAALALIRALGRPIAAPSANLFGRTSPTTAKAVIEDLKHGVDMVLDGGPATVGLESTVIKVERKNAVLLRPGGITVEELKKILPIKRTVPSRLRFESPGLLKSHYAPKTPLVLLSQISRTGYSQAQKFFNSYKKKFKKSPRLGLLAFSQMGDKKLFRASEVLSSKKDLAEAASNLFEAMRKLDRMKLDLIVAQPVPSSGIGLAIMDRLRKASGGRSLGEFK